MTRRLIIAISLTSILFGFIIGLAVQAIAFTPSAHSAAWREAEHRGLITGDPYYYINDADQDAINHALLTAILTLDLNHQDAALSPTNACNEGDYVAHQQAAPDSYMSVYSTANPGPDAANYTRAIGFNRDGTLEYLFNNPQLGAYGPAEFHVLCHG